VTEKSIIIIGAGLSGLAAGCYAQMNGYQSQIFEHHRVPGGVAACWKRKGYLIDGGIHFLMGHKPGTELYQLYRQLGIVPAVSVVDMTTFGRFTDETSGRSVEVTRDLDRLAADWKAGSPADAQIIDELITGARSMQGLDLGAIGMGKPPELMGVLDRIKEMWDMRNLLRYMTGRYAKPVSNYVQNIQDPWLQECIKSLFLPQVPVWFVCMILGLLADGQIGFLTRGCPDFVQPMEKRYRELGGRVTYRAAVEKILVKDNRAVGVRLADSSQHYAGVVASAADGYSTIFGLLDGRYVDHKTRDRYANWELCRPLMMVSYGVAREFPADPPFITFLLEHPLQSAGQSVDKIFVRLFNYSPHFSPAGKTVVQVEFETDWDYWNDLRQEGRPGYNAQKERVAAEILERLERHYPGISSQVQVTDEATPYTTWRYTRNHKGSWGGWMPTPQALNTRIKRTLPGLENFYMAGQWITPGGGVPPCLYSGRHVAQLLCHRDGKPFTTTLPKGLRN